jgi:hypothetical protein
MKVFRVMAVFTPALAIVLEPIGGGHSSSDRAGIAIPDGLANFC